MNPEAYTGCMVHRAYKLLSYVSTGRKFTITDITSHLQCSKTTAYRHLEGLSIYFPITELPDEVRGNSRGKASKVYKYIKGVP